jgi:type IV secretory pathway TrbD component
MNVVSQFVAAVLRTVLKLGLLAAALVFVASLLIVALISIVFVLLKALVTGRKPEFVTSFQRFNQARQQFRRGGAAASASAGDVMDVQAREVPNDAPLPYDASHDKS